MKSATYKKILVLGGYGFIGRHVVKHLRANRHIVTVGSRTPRNGDDAIKCIAHKETTESLTDLCAGYDVIINTIGILRERINETYDTVHHRFVAHLADACRANNTRLLHISAMGLNNPVASRFLTSKRAGEKALKRTNADWLIIRPSLIDGATGYGAKWFRRLANWPVHFAPSNAKGILNPIHVEDLATAIATLASLGWDELKLRGIKSREIELGGGKEVGIFEYLGLLKRRPKLRLRVPALVVRLASHICDALHLTPLSFGHYELLKFDNRPVTNHLPLLLNRAPRKLGDHENSPINPAPLTHGAMA